MQRGDPPFRLLTRVVDADRFTDVGIPFPALWIDPGRWGMPRRADRSALSGGARRKAYRAKRHRSAAEGAKEASEPFSDAAERRGGCNGRKWVGTLNDRT